MGIGELGIENRFRGLSDGEMAEGTVLAAGAGCFRRGADLGVESPLEAVDSCVCRWAPGRRRDTIAE
jgi:hypothetical protein